MKKIILPLIIPALFFSCQSKKYPTGIAPKEIIIPNELEITKLIIEGKDRTEQLGRIRITDRQWSEYDREGNVIGVAEIKTVKNNLFDIKWTMAENGADVGEHTIYEYHILFDKVLFTIWFDKAQKGYFEATLKQRD